MGRNPIHQLNVTEAKTNIVQVLLRSFFLLALESSMSNSENLGNFSGLCRSAAAKANLAMGVDLGATNGCVAFWEEGSVGIVSNSQGQTTRTLEDMLREKGKNLSADEITKACFNELRQDARRVRKRIFCF
jgi:hypothetical protein